MRREVHFKSPLLGTWSENTASPGTVIRFYGSLFSDLSYECEFQSCQTSVMTARVTALSRVQLLSYYCDVPAAPGDPSCAEISTAGFDACRLRFNTPQVCAGSTSCSCAVIGIFPPVAATGIRPGQCAYAEVWRIFTVSIQSSAKVSLFFHMA